MAREKSVLGFSGSLEVEATAPLDARTVVPLKADLTDASNFPYAYEGLTVYVAEEKKSYTLTGDDTTVLANWKEVGSGSGGGGSADWADITNKPENIVTDADYVHTDNNYTDADKDKLDSIQPGETVTQEWNEQNRSIDMTVGTQTAQQMVLTGIAMKSDIAEAMTDVDNEHFHIVTALPEAADAKDNHEYVVVTYEQDGVTIATEKHYLFYGGAFHERKTSASISGYATEQYVDDGLATKQDALTAGNGVEILPDGTINMTKNVIRSSTTLWSGYQPPDYYAQNHDRTINITLNDDFNNYDAFVLDYCPNTNTSNRQQTLVEKPTQGYAVVISGGQGNITFTFPSADGVTAGIYSRRTQSGNNWYYTVLLRVLGIKYEVAGGGGGTVDQTYDATSTNAQSGTAVAEAIAAIPSGGGGGNTTFDVATIPQGPTGANEINASVSNTDNERAMLSYIRQADGTLPDTVRMNVQSGLGEDSFELPTKAYVDGKGGGGGSLADMFDYDAPALVDMSGAHDIAKFMSAYLNLPGMATGIGTSRLGYKVPTVTTGAYTWADGADEQTASADVTVTFADGSTIDKTLNFKTTKNRWVNAAKGVDGGYIDTGLTLDYGYTLFYEGYQPAGASGAPIGAFTSSAIRTTARIMGNANKMQCMWPGNTEFTSAATGINFNEPHTAIFNANGVELTQGSTTYTGALTGTSSGTDSAHILIFNEEASSSQRNAVVQKAGVRSGTDTLREIVMAEINGEIVGVDIANLTQAEQDEIISEAYSSVNASRIHRPVGTLEEVI